jgi:hypothetical protein
MGCQLPGSLALDGADLRTLFEAIEQRTVERGTAMMGNLKPQRRLHLTLIGLAMELNLGLVIMDCPAPWICPRGG